jgi:hypothetical protein
VNTEVSGALHVLAQFADMLQGLGVYGWLVLVLLISVGYAEAVR